MKLFNISDRPLAQQSKNFDEVVNLPDNLKNLWGNTTPENCTDVVKRLVQWVVFHADNIDYIYVSGLPGAVYKLVKILTDPLTHGGYNCVYRCNSNWYNYKDDKPVFEEE